MFTFPAFTTPPSLSRTFFRSVLETKMLLLFAELFKKGEEVVADEVESPKAGLESEEALETAVELSSSEFLGLKNFQYTEKQN